MYYSKCHGKLPLPGIFRFPANCHAPPVLLLLLAAEASTVLPKEALISLSANSSPGPKLSRLPFTQHA